MNTLDRIAQSYGTDKSSEYHNYCDKYEKYFPFKRDDKLKILEIGVFNGKSLKTWKDFYFNSEIIGIDIDPKCFQYNEDRIQIEIGSQNDLNFLIEIKKKYGEFDLIVDDGSHINSDIIFSFNVLFNSLKSGGVYVVEDAVTSYWTEFGGGINMENTTMEYFKKLTDDVNFRGIRWHKPNGMNARNEEYLIPLSQEIQPDRRIDIESINFLNSIILITKR